MTLKLRVLHGTLKHQDGAAAGTEIKVHEKKRHFIIGSASDCQMRCPSSTISPHHCEITHGPEGFVIRDLGSASGTHVNGERIEQDQLLHQGDQLRVGRLEFEVVLEEAAPVTPPPVTSSTIAAEPDPEGDQISEMLVAADQADRAQRREDPAKRQFEVSAQETPKASTESESDARAKKFVRPPKRPPQKLPPPPKLVAEDTVHAAEEVLKKFFERPKK